MKDFDAERQARRQAALEEDRGFTIGGETFLRAVEVRPEALAVLDKVKPPVRDTDGKVVDPGSGVGNDIGAIDDIVLAMIDPADDAHARYRALRERDADFLTLADMQDLMQWLLEQVTGRPTVPSSSSTPQPVEAGIS